MVISQKDRERLRALAAHQMELATSPAMQQTIKDWQALNSFRMNRPMVYLEMGTFAHEIIPQRMQCEGEEARGIEWQMLSNTLQSEVLGDDYVVPAYFPTGWQVDFNLFGMESKRTHAEDDKGSQTLGHQFVHAINDLEDDWEQLGHSTWSVNREGTQARIDLLEDVFGGILPVKMAGRGLYSVPTQKVVHIIDRKSTRLNSSH